MTAEEIKASVTVPEILQKYGVKTSRNRCRAICHEGTHNTARVSDELYYCFKCNKKLDVFEIVMHFEGVDFAGAFELLGGREKPSFTTYIKAQRAQRERAERMRKAAAIKAERDRINMYITACRGLMEQENRLSDLYTYCYNKLQYYIYLLTVLDERG